MMEYTIRAALPEDLEGLYGVFILADKVHQQAHPEIFKKTDDSDSVKEFLLASIRSSDSAIFVAQNQIEIVGAVLAFIRQTRDISILVQRTYLSVDNLVVAEGHRQKGLGRALMEEVHLWAKDRGINQIHLTVWDFNKGAQEFYTKLGYKMLHHRMRKVLS
jgi:GNAT superfamily N-acetyltransferase